MTDPTLTALVVAVGGNVSQGILKALALSRVPCRVIGADIAPMKMGLYTVDRACLAPWAHEPRFVDWLINICLKENVHAVLSGAEPVLPVLAEHAEEVRRRTGAVCIVSAPATLAIGDDKLLTSQWLEQHGFACPAYAVSEDRRALAALAADHGFPLVAKPRRGGGCRGLIHLVDSADLDYIARKQNYIVQQHVGDPASEFTAGCFSDRDGQVRGAIVMRRELHEGTTISAQAGGFPAIREEAIRIAEALRPMGPCNIQFRTVDDRPVCLEINVRFSGTTPVRARWGFNEVEEAIRHYVLGQPARDLPIVTQGLMVRYWNELYINPDAYVAISESGLIDNPRKFPMQFEDFGFLP